MYFISCLNSSVGIYYVLSCVTYMPNITLWNFISFSGIFIQSQWTLNIPLDSLRINLHLNILIYKILNFLSDVNMMAIIYIYIYGKSSRISIQTPNMYQNSNSSQGQSKITKYNEAFWISCIYSKILIFWCMFSDNSDT